jgi:hypothetical protein
MCVCVCATCVCVCALRVCVCVHYTSRCCAGGHAGLVCERSVNVSQHSVIVALKPMRNILRSTKVPDLGSPGMEVLQCTVSELQQRC